MRCFKYCTLHHNFCKYHAVLYLYIFLSMVTMLYILCLVSEISTLATHFLAQLLHVYKTLLKK
jgi:uncharacterized membrane protein